MVASFPDRRFQLWRYDVSHGSLLIRSPKGPDVEGNVDLLFAGVEFLSAPRHLRGLVVESASADDLSRAQEAMGREVAAERLFVLVSNGHRHLVVAAGSEVRQHDGDIFDDPFESPPS
jgi:hypothetical protein